MTQRNKYRIIAGLWRGRVLRFPDADGLRPTTDRVRETLFNWLQMDIRNSSCLDLFAGSGGLSLEALSRGAASVTAIEVSPAACDAIRENCLSLQAERLSLINTDALQWLASKTPASPFDIVFLDPPFEGDLLAPCCDLLERFKWLKPGGSIYLETNSPLETVPTPANWSQVRAKKAGQVYYGLYSRACA